MQPVNQEVYDRAKDMTPEQMKEAGIVEITIEEMAERDKPKKCWRCEKDCEVTLDWVPYGDGDIEGTAVVYHFDCEDCGKYTS